VAKSLRGDLAISAIRVRVALEGCPGDYLTCPLTAQNQRKIETIAGEIARRTGLDVDIMVGSSPAPVLVHIPEIGYVEEQWIQKNVSSSYEVKVQTGHLLLLGTLLGIGGVFALDLSWADVVSRRKTIALQKALGWRSSTVFRQVLGQILLVGALAAGLGTLLAVGLSFVLNWERPSLSLSIGLPLLIVALAGIGGLYPAWLAARLPPVIGLRRGNAGITAKLPSFHLPPSSFIVLAWQGLSRRWSRTFLGAMTATLSAALLVLMLSVTVDRQGAMNGTLLGEFILVHIEGYHYAIVGIGFGLAALSLANSLLAGVLERRREIGVLKAVGWRTGEVARLFLYEGALIGGLGGMVGAVVGVAVFVGLYETVTPNLIWIGLAGAGLPVIVGLLAALYPARIAANIPPAEAVRYE
jgi:predicted lysophospholipase L1 biosynthesis ABC-type transport system permease subunit